MEFNSFEAIGLIGAALYLFSYIRVQYDKEYVKTYNFSLLNAIAAFLVLISFYEYWNFAAAVGQLTWFIVSLYGIKSSLKSRTKIDPKFQSQSNILKV